MPLLSKHVFCNGFEPLTLLHRKAETSAASRRARERGGFHRGLRLPVLADRSTPKVEEGRHMTPDSVYYI